AQKADGRKVDQLLSLLRKKGQIESYAEDVTGDAALSSHGLTEKDAAAVVSIWVDGVAKEDRKEEKKDDKKEGEKKEEKKEDKKPTLKKEKDVEVKPAVKLIFGNKDGNTVWVQRIVGDEKKVLRVKDVVLEGEKDQNSGEVLIPAAGAAALAFRTKELPRFNEAGGPHGFADSTAGVIKLVVHKDGQNYVVVRNQKKDAKPDAKFEDKYEDTWKLAKPEKLADREANALEVRRILDTLNNLQAVELKAEESDAAKLDTNYGLKEPTLWAVVTVLKDGKEKTFEYDFGKEANATTGTRYGKMADSPLVFTVRKNDLFALSSAEFREPTVVKFDIRKARKITLEGWGRATGES